MFLNLSKNQCILHNSEQTTTIFQIVRTHYRTPNNVTFAYLCPFGRFSLCVAITNLQQDVSYAFIGRGNSIIITVGLLCVKTTRGECLRRSFSQLSFVFSLIIILRVVIQNYQNAISK